MHGRGRRGARADATSAIPDGAGSRRLRAGRGRLRRLRSRASASGQLSPLGFGLRRARRRLRELRRRASASAAVASRELLGLGAAFGFGGGLSVRRSFGFGGLLRFRSGLRVGRFWRDRRTRLRLRSFASAAASRELRRPSALRRLELRHRLGVCAASASASAFGATAHGLGLGCSLSTGFAGAALASRPSRSDRLARRRLSASAGLRRLGGLRDGLASRDLRLGRLGAGAASLRRPPSAAAALRAAAFSAAIRLGSRIRSITIRGGLLRISSFTPAFPRRRRMWATVETRAILHRDQADLGAPRAHAARRRGRLQRHDQLFHVLVDALLDPVAGGSVELEDHAREGRVVADAHLHHVGRQARRGAAAATPGR